MTAARIELPARMDSAIEKIPGERQTRSETETSDQR
jgi:hypothetical protein